MVQNSQRNIISFLLNSHRGTGFLQHLNIISRGGEGMNFLTITHIEGFLLLINLIAILFFVVLRKRTISIILISIALIQYFILHWNNLISSFLWVLNMKF